MLCSNCARLNVLCQSLETRKATLESCFLKLKEEEQVMRLYLLVCCLQYLSVSFLYMPFGIQHWKPSDFWIASFLISEGADLSASTVNAVEDVLVKCIRKLFDRPNSLLEPACCSAVELYRGCLEKMNSKEQVCHCV